MVFEGLKASIWFAPKASVCFGLKSSISSDTCSGPLKGKI